MSGSPFDPRDPPPQSDGEDAHGTWRPGAGEGRAPGPARLVEELAERVERMLPRDLRVLAEDMRRNLRETVAATLARMDLVTREELEVERELLRVALRRIEALESRVAALEAARAREDSAPGGQGQDPAP